MVASKLEPSTVKRNNFILQMSNISRMMDLDLFFKKDFLQFTGRLVSL